MPERSSWMPWLLVALVAAGILAQVTGVLDWPEAIDRAREQGERWWLPPAIVAAMALLFAFGLPGSTLIFVAGAVYPPPVATAIVLAGGIAGGLAAYFLARSLGRGRVDGGEEGRLLRLFRRRSDTLTLISVRTLPTFPHSAINYSAGWLGVPLPRFLFASAVGLTLKGWLYVTAIHRAAGLDALEEALSWKVVWPLAALAALFLAAALVRERWNLRRKETGEPGGGRGPGTIQEP